MCSTRLGAYPPADALDDAMENRFEPIAGYVRIGARAQQASNRVDLHAPAASQRRGCVQRHTAVAACRIRVGAALEQDRDGFGFAVQRRVEQHRIDVDTRPGQGAYHWRLVCARRFHELRPQRSTGHASPVIRRERHELNPTPLAGATSHRANTRCSRPFRGRSPRSRRHPFLAPGRRGTHPMSNALRTGNPDRTLLARTLGEDPRGRLFPASGLALPPFAHNWPLTRATHTRKRRLPRGPGASTTRANSCPSGQTDAGICDPDMASPPCKSSGRAHRVGLGRTPAEPTGAAARGSLLSKIPADTTGARIRQTAG